jgi:hypothetical protein
MDNDFLWGVNSDGGVTVAQVDAIVQGDTLEISVLSGP